MKRNPMLAVLLLAAFATAQAADPKPAAEKPVQHADLTDAPPPAMDDPGVKAVPPTDLGKAKAD